MMDSIEEEEDLISGYPDLEDLHAAMRERMPTSRGGKGASQTALLLAFPLITYAHSISEYCQKHKIRRVFFLSREGLFLKRLFENTDQSGIETHYFCVSRVSLFILTVDALKEETVESLLDRFDTPDYIPNVAIDQLLHVLKIDDDETRNIVRDLGYNPKRAVPLRANRDSFKSVLLDSRIRDHFARKRKSYLDLFGRYLKSWNLEDCQDILLCDMGWSGSMQTYLARLCKEQGFSVRIHGFYLGYAQAADAKKNPEKLDNVIKSGYFIHDGSASRIAEELCVNHIPLEILGTAPHGTVLSYRDCEDGVKPVFRHVPEEMWQHRFFIQPFQNQVLDFAKRYQSEFKDIFQHYPSEELYQYNLKIMLSVFGEPSPEFRHYFAFIFYDDFFGKNIRIFFAPYVSPRRRERLRWLFRARSFIFQTYTCLVPKWLQVKWGEGPVHEPSRITPCSHSKVTGSTV